MVSLNLGSIVTVIVTVIAIALLIYNTIYVNTLRAAIRDNPVILGSVLSETGADVLFWLNIAFIILLILFLIYTMVIIFTSKSDQEKIREFLTRSQRGRGSRI